MFFALLVSLSQSNRRICICNKGCHFSCPINSYDTSSTNINFKDYILSQIRNEDEINIDFYSKQKEFIFSIESSYFDGIKVTIRVLSDSKPIFLKINQETLQDYKKIKLESNQQIDLSDLIPYSPTIPVNSRHILESSDITTIPMSVSLPRMDYSGSATCSYSTNSQDGSQNKPIGEYTNMQAVGCPNDASNSQCGVRCWGNDINYSYTFKGVKFAIYGTEDSGHGKFDVYLDGNNITRVNEYSTTRTTFKLLFSSEILNYREHTIKIASTGDTYELYKFVYWPSVRAIRVNSTAFTKTGWTQESDGIGGFREYKANNVLATLTIYCSRFWFYGLNDDNLGDLTIKYNNVTEVINQHSTTRKEGILIYESPLLDYFSITITLTSSTTTMISALYYEEPPIPISVGIVYMDTKDVDQCNYYTKNSLVSLDTVKNNPTAHGGCSPSDDLDTQSAYRCGIRCWGNNAQYNYTFKGVKFALYGTFKTTHYNVSVALDDEIIATVSENGQENGPAIIYESKLLEYGEHKVGYIGIGQANEFYKLVYWPSLRARRANATQFTKNDNWNNESDNIGGIRQQKDTGAYAIITLQCSRFWIYGLRNNNMGQTTFNFNGQSQTINLYDNIKKEGVLIFESPELEYTAKTISIAVAGDKNFKFNCIYYEEPPNPVITPIPISVSLNQMYIGGHIEKCENHKNAVISTNNVSYNNDNFGCATDNLNSVDAYNCGLRCYGKTMKYKYTFKGVKFAIYGTITLDNFDTSVIKVNGKEIARVNQYGSKRTPYILLYESNIYPYNDYTVEIESLDSNKLYEIYKLVFWPSMRVNRYNSTEFIEDGTWDRQTDGIGGIRTYSNARIVSFDKSFYCSRFWLYGSTMDWNEGFDLSYDGNTEFIGANTQTRIDMVLLKGSNEMSYKLINLHGKTKGDATFNCVFYTYEPYIDEYINKTFKRVLPYFDILVTANSIINEISGCEFNNISENSDFVAKLEKEIPFYNNSFYYNSEQSHYPSPVNVRYNGKITIINCNFKNARGNEYYSNTYTGILHFNNNNIIEATVISCEFINCELSNKNRAIIRMENADSSLNVDNCTFRNDNPITAKVIDTKCINLVVNNCRFIKTSKVARRIPQGDKLPGKTLNFVLTNCIFDSSTGDANYDGICYHLEFSRPATVIFENNIITNLKYDEKKLNSILIDTDNTIDQLVLRNLSFIDNSCSAYTGGGSGIVLREVKYVIFVDCKFINNKAVQYYHYDPSYINLDRKSGDGGGVHLGLLCRTVEGAIKFDNCIFKDNKASKHGGAIAIQTLNTVEIVNCIFDSNKANYDFSSNKLLFENHFNKKSDGRGGAIYINPTFHYNFIDYQSTCYNLSAFMTSVSIKNSTFISNSAYDGYGIYVEGDDGGTKFEIEGNNFTNNYKSDPNDENDINISTRGIIASEVHTIPNDVIEKNHFAYDLERVKPHKLVFVDHYGNIIPTFYFTESHAFSYSKDFSHSADFSHSTSFSNSADFTNSDAFSYSSVFTNSKTFPTKKFTKSSEFSYSNKFSSSNKFSESDQFSNTNNFSISQGFSNSDKFTKTKEFSETGKFSKTELFTFSTQFSESRPFSGSKQFSNSIGFSRSQPFSYTEKFSKSLEFSFTEKFSVSQFFTESSKFSDSKTFSDSKQFTNTNEFSKTQLFSYTDQFSKSQLFSKTTKFSDSNKFSKSDNFLPSTVFSNSIKFSESIKFTKTNAFSETQSFTETIKFSESKSFSDSKEFSSTIEFSKTNKFTFSGEFSNTYEFSDTGEFSISTKFTESGLFSGTQSFSLSGGFSKSSKFSHSELFTETARFSVSNQFSASQHYSASEFFTESASFTPEFIEDPSCVVLVNDFNITLYRCSYAGEDETVLVRIIKTNFTEYYNESNGGAILIYNCGFECVGVNFTDCVSLNGAGGAIYLKNSRPLKYNATINNTWFTRCKAVYGGACYIYSSSDVNHVLFSFCVFQFNTLNGNNNKQELFGGTSLFLTAKNGNISKSYFYANKGKTGSLKIYNTFDGENQIKQLDEEDDKKLNSFSISNCDFVNEKDEEMSKMIYYVSGKDASEVEINDCKFKGKLSNGSHYIEGKILDKDRQKLQIKSCKFDKEDKDSVKIELVDDLIQKEMNIDLSSNISDFKEKDIFTLVLYFGLFFVIAFMAALLLYLKRVHFHNQCKEENHFNVEL